MIIIMVKLHYIFKCPSVCPIEMLYRNCYFQFKILNEWRFSVLLCIVYSDCSVSLPFMHKTKRRFSIFMIWSFLSFIFSFHYLITTLYLFSITNFKTFFVWPSMIFFMLRYLLMLPYLCTYYTGLLSKTLD